MRITRDQLRRIISEELSMFSEGVSVVEAEPDASHSGHMIFVSKGAGQGGAHWRLRIQQAPSDLATRTVPRESDEQEAQMVQDAKAAIDDYVSSGEWPEGWSSVA